MRSCDVLIVGGGPAGSSCAARLVAAGLRVTVVDRGAFPRDKVCAGWITPAVVRALRLDLEDYGRTRTLQPFLGFQTGAFAGRRWPRLRRTDFGRAVSYGIRRCEFDEYLLARSGAELPPPMAVRDVRHDGDAWIVNGELRARMLVGAGGHFCPVARALNGPSADGPAIVAQEIEFEMSDRELAACPVEPHAPELFFRSDWTGLRLVRAQGALPERRRRPARTGFAA